MSRRLALLALTLVAFAMSACASPTGPAPTAKECVDYQGSSTKCR